MCTMKKFIQKLCLFIYMLLILLLCPCFGKINPAIRKNNTDQSHHYHGDKILLKKSVVKNIKHKKIKTNNAQPSLKSSGNDSLSIWSNSFNFAKSGNSEVDPRTGSLLVSVEAGLLLSNFGHGPDIDLEMNYNSIAKGNPDHLGRGWAWNLTHYNPVTHQLSTSGGKSFFLQQQSDGRWSPLYHKLKDVIITSEKGHLVITSANGLRDILNHDGYETRLEQKNGDGVNFSYVAGSHILKKITDDHGHSIQLIMKDNYLTVSSYDVKGQPVNIRIDLNEDEVRNIWFPDTHQKITDNSNVVHLSYGSDSDDQGLLTSIHYFTGMEKKFVYDCKHEMKQPTVIPYDKSIFQPFAPVCVVKQVRVVPGANQPPMIVNYRYTAINSNNHDYLGYNSGLISMPGLKRDILFEAPASYTYKTEEDNGQVQVIRTYDKYHLLIDSKTVSDKDNKLLSETHAYFCSTEKEDGCANTSFDQLPVTYSLPLKVVHKSWGDNLSAPTVTSIQRSYDDNGRIIRETDSYGRRKEITYCPQHGDSHCPATQVGWPVATLAETTKIFPAPVNESVLLSPVITTMDYQKQSNRNGQGYILVLNKKTVQSGNINRIETREYYHDNTNPLTYGLLKQKQLEGTDLPEGSVKTITHHYQYALNNDGTETITGYTDIADNQSVLSSVTEKSLFVPKILRVISADKKNIHNLTYDNMDRLITRTDGAGTPFETTTHYQYTLSASENSVLVTTPEGIQKKVIFDGLGRILNTYVEKTDHQGHLQHGLWQQQTQIRYNAEGKVAENTRYIDNGQNKGIASALTTHFEYDNLGRLIRKHLPDGETEVTKYDDAHRCIVHYTQDIDNHRTSVIINLSNILGKPIKQIVLPVTSGILPSVELLCTQGDKQPDAKVSTMTYDGFDHLISTKDPMGKIVQYHHDVFGHVTEIIDPVGDKLHDVYDLTGHVIQHLVMPAKGGQYLLASAAFNAAGQKLWSAGEDGQKTIWHYNINGEVSDVYKPNGHHITMDYNIIGLPIKDSLDGKPFLQVNYDHISHQPLTVTDNTGVITYHYLNDRLLEGVTQKGINGYYDSCYSFAYDNYHRLISRTDAHNNKTIYTFDTLGRPTGKTYQENNKSAVQVDRLMYGAFSRIVKRVYGNGTERTLSYGPWGQVSIIKDRRNEKLLYASSFVYDADGNIVRLTRTDDKNNKSVVNYSYDRMNNMVTMDCQGDNMLCPHDTTFRSGNLKTAPVIIQQDYRFTPLNRIASVTEKLVDTSSYQQRSLSKNMTYAYSNSKAPLRLTAVSTQWNNQQPDTHTFTYDTTGNMTTDGEGNKISYNAFNQITRVVNTAGSTSSYDYDGQGKEVKSVTAQGARQMIYQGQSLSGEIITGTDNDIHYIDYPAAGIKTTDNTITDWYESNYKGDIIGVYKKDKKSGEWIVQQHRIYSPYGMVWSYDKKNTTLADFQQTLKGFDGEITDSATGWQFLGAGHRTYNPAQRYFFSEDPAGDGYAFGSNNPVMNSDPSGNIPKWLGKVTSIASTVLSLGLTRSHNKFIRGIGRSLFFAVTAASLATFAIGLVFAVPAALTFASSAKPANKGLQTAAMTSGMVCTGAMFAAGVLTMGAGIYAAAGALATLFRGMRTLASFLSGVDAFQAVADETANDIVEGVGNLPAAEGSGSAAANSNNVTESAGSAAEQIVQEESSTAIKQAIITQDASSFSREEIPVYVLPEPEIDMFYIKKLPSEGLQLLNFIDMNKYIEQEGENIYDEILLQYEGGDFFESAYRLLKPGGKLYIINPNIEAYSSLYRKYEFNGLEFFDSHNISSCEVNQFARISHFEISGDFEAQGVRLILVFKK